MKTKMKLIALIVLSVGLVSAAFASWGHSQTSPGQYSAYPYVPGPAHVQQTFQAFNYYVGSTPHFGQVVNDGPLGSYNAGAGPQQSYEGDIGGGVNVNVYQVVIESGYSVTVITW